MRKIPTTRIKARRSICLLMLLVLGALSGCDKIFSQEHTVCVAGFNEFDRKIHEFWLDEEHHSGCFGNPSGREAPYAYGGGGGFACGCQVTPGEKVKLEWTLVVTREEFDAGVPMKSFERIVTIPQPQSSGSRYLYIYFKRDDTNPIQWLDHMSEPTIPPSEETRNDK